MAGSIDVIVSVDWEGRALVPESLEAMSDFRECFPDIPLQQFLNAAYYTKDGADHPDVTRKIRSVLRDHDEHGLHIHGWCSLFTAAEVEPKEQPTLFNRETPLKIVEGDWGHEVCIDAYTIDELRQVIQLSRRIMKNQGFRRPRSFRAGAWLASEGVMEALVLEGFENDCSAAWIKPLFMRWGEFNLYRRGMELWSDISQTSQPFGYELSGGGFIQEIPNNGCLADYVSADEMVETLELNIKKLKEDPAVAARTVSIGFHQETACKYIKSLHEAIPRYRALAQREEVDLHFGVAIKD